MSEEPLPSSANKNWYEKIFKWILIIPIVLLLFCIVFLYNFNQTNGDIILKDVSLTGGTTITVFDSSFDTSNLKTSLQTEFPDISIRVILDFTTREQIAFFVESVSEPEKLTLALENQLGYSLNSDNSSVEFSGSSISSGFYNQLKIAILLAFVFMAIVVLFIFRTPIPSLAIIFSALADIIMTIVVLNIFQIPLSIGGIVAILMLIGYSVDTDILLTTRLLKRREENVNKRTFEAFKTGLTMTITSIAAVSVALIAVYNFSESLRQIFTILLIGLGFDVFNTWVTNASILRWYMEVKKIQ